MDGSITLSPTIPVNDFFAQVKEAVRQVMYEHGAPDQDEVLTSDQVMKMCKVSHVTLQNWRNANKIPFNKIGNKILYSKNEVLKLIASKPA
jgi:hypothetical protein